MNPSEKEALRNLLEIEISAGRVIPTEIRGDYDIVLEYSKESEYALARVLMQFDSFDLRGLCENALQFACAEEMSDVCTMVHHEISKIPHGEYALHLLFNALCKEVYAQILVEVKEDVFSGNEITALAKLSPSWEALEAEYERTIAEDND